MEKVALITGVTGQDGSYLAELLLEKGYRVHGIKRRSSSLNTERIDHVYEGPQTPDPRFVLHYGDLSDASCLAGVVARVQPDEIYNLGAMSHVAVSFEQPEYTGNTDGLGTLRLLDAIRFVGLEEKVRFYQASTSELFGLVQETPQSETTPFYPRSPYACAKLFAYWTVVNYREAHGIHASNGILFNHESPRRGETFVSRKITRGLARIAVGHEKSLSMGNLDAKRDWGHAKDYVKSMWLMLQQDRPDDYVVASGTQYSVRELIEFSAAQLGIEIDWQRSGVDEVGIAASVNGDAAPAVRVGQKIIDIDPRYFRPTEVETLLGDATKARRVLGWQPSISFEEMVAEMVSHDLEGARKTALLKQHGFETPQPSEH